MDEKTNPRTAPAYREGMTTSSLHEFAPRVSRTGPRETGEYEELIYCIIFWSHTGPDPVDAWLSDGFYLYDVNAQDALNWGRANVADGEILEVQALSVAGDDVVAYTLFGNRPTKNPQIEPYPPPSVPRNALESRAAASENW